MAETRTIRTVLELNAQRFTTGAAQASASAKSLAGELAKVGDAQGAQRANFDRVSNSLLGVGTAAAAGLGMAAKASMDWESSWAGVLKTVDGTPEQLKAVEDGLRGLAQELPASHQEIAAVAEAAGQLGVQTGSVVEFTRTMIDLGETTNLSAEEAATSLARFSNIMGTSQDDVDRLGSTLVGLGNNFATTEGEIMAMGMRLSGIGAQLGLTEGDVLGLAAAMSSVGIEAEAGGTAMTMGMKKIDSAVREGGESLAGFAEVAGMSNEEFAKLWSEDSAAGLEAFVHGLANAGAEGESMSAILSDLGIKGIREADTFLRLAANADGLSEALAQGNTEFDRNLALVEEANKRYETTESQLKIARNAIVDAGIEIGASLLPVLADAAGGIADLAGWFGALPDPVQRSVTGLGAIVATTGLVAGGLMKVVPAAMDTVAAFRDLRTTSPNVAKGLSSVAGFATRAGVAFVGLQAAGAIADQFREAATTSDEMAAGLLNAAETGGITTGVIDNLVSATGTGNASVTDLANALDILDANAVEKAGDFLASGLGVWDTQTEVATQQVQELDRALASLYTSGNTQAVAKVLEESGVAFEDLIKHMPTLRTELTTVATSMGLTADDATLMKIATGELVPVVDEATGAVTGYNTAQDAAEGATDEATGAVEEQVSALEALQNMLEDTANLLLGVRGSERDFQAAIDDASASVDEHGQTLDRATEAGRANEAALDGIADSAHKWADAAQESGASAEELDGIMRSGRDSFISTAEAMGMSTEEATALADELQLIPDFVETEVEVETEQARADLARLWEEQELHPPQIPVTADTEPAEGELAEFHGLVGDKPADVPVDADTGEAERKVNTFGQKVGETPTGDVPIDADTSPAEEELHIFGSRAGDYSATVIIDADTYYGEDQLRQFQSAVNEAGGTVTINGETMNGQQALAALVQEVNAGQGYVDINGTPVNAESALLMLVDHINNSGGTVTIDGDKVPAQLKTGEVKKQIDGTEGTVTIDGNNAPANRATDSAKRKADGTTGTIDVNANTRGAESSINSTARDRTSTIRGSAQTGSAESALNRAARTRTARIVVSYSDPGFKGSGGSSGFANGGWLNRGLNAGGWVPGPYPGPGIDNVLWPVRSGLAGGGLQLQPLAGTEFVVNGRSARQWGPALEAINSGMSSSEVAALIGAQAGSAGVNVSQQISGLNAYEVARESRAQMQHVLRDAVPTLSR